MGVKVFSIPFTIVCGLIFVLWIFIFSILRPADQSNVNPEEISAYINVHFAIAKSVPTTFLTKTRSSESDGRSDVTDSLDCHDMFRLP